MRPRPLRADHTHHNRNHAPPPHSITTPAILLEDIFVLRADWSFLLSR